MEIYNCFPVSEGYGIGKALILENEYELIEYSDKDIEFEIRKYSKALEKAIRDIDATIEKNPTSTDILGAHLMLLQDVEFKDSVNNYIDEGFSAEYSIKLTSDSLQSMFSLIEDEYLKERALDIKDISERLINNILGKNIKIEKEEDFIVITEDLLPSQTANLNKKFVKGIITSIGGRTSHTAILANIMGIASNTEFTNISSVKNDDIIIVDGFEGKVIVNPIDDVLNEYKEKIDRYNTEKNELLKYKNMKSKTLDGQLVNTFINIGSLDDMDMFESSGSEGVGLFRTEFLYMKEKQKPSIEIQYQVYKEVLKKAKGKTVIFRTLDIGGDKDISYLNFPKEMNPFLGFRAIRYCLSNTEIFKDQITAILKASVYGDAWIMIPMISTVSEIIDVKNIINEVENELEELKVDYKKCKVGIMIETPSAAIMSDLLAKEVDFFSIGTNDLTQYTLACDRMNNSLKYLYNYFDPSVLRLIDMTIKNAKKSNIHVGMCGEAASDKLLIPLLISMGIDELSMSSSKVLSVKKMISKFDKNLTNIDVREILNSRTAKEVMGKLSSVLS